MIQVESDWLRGPDRPVVDGQDVHVWRADLPTEHRALEILRPTLSPDECERAARFHFTRHRENFIIARGLLRRVLGRYLDLPPERLKFTYGMHGKPALSIHSQSDPLSFNLSHAGDVAVYAITRGRDVGVDIETIEKGRLTMQVAERFFSPAELSTLRSLPQHQQTEALFNCWTRKEAYVKGLGKGFAHSLHEFTVSVMPGGPATVISGADHDTSWSLVHFSPGAGYAGAVAVRGKLGTVRYWQC